MPSATQLYSSGRWLNAADMLPLMTRRTAIIHTVEEAQVGMGADQKVQLNLSLVSRQGQAWPKTLLLNKGNTMQLVAAYGDDYSQWHGKAIETWAENVMFQGKLVPGIKVVAAPNGAAQPSQQAPAPAPTNGNGNPAAAAPPSATAVAGMPPAAKPVWNTVPAGTPSLEDDEIPF